MNEEYLDRPITCSDCGNDFVWTAKDQAFYAEKGLVHPPKRCKPCRIRRKEGSAK